jgi:putative SOS response-associated peptidase YedK
VCGRYASARSVEDLATTFGIADQDVETVAAPDWNIAPTKAVTAVLTRAHRPRLTRLIWGLVPSWADDPSMGQRLINARVETVAEKPAFRDALRVRRCLLPADGWYEWARRPDGARLPHFLTSSDGFLLTMAGLWEQWRDAEGRTLATATILTGPAPERLRAVHDRAPIVLTADMWSVWLDPQSPRSGIEAVLATGHHDRITVWPVGPEVGDVANNGPQLARPVEVDEQPALF